MKRPVRIWWILAVSSAYSIVLGSILSLWIATNSLAAFRVAEYTHQFDQFINDNFLSNLLLSRERIYKSFDDVINTYETEVLLTYVSIEWAYKNDMIYWDVANMPVASFIDLTGDCDDIARLYAYILNRKGYLTFFVTMASPISGHAVAVYFDSLKRKTIMAEQSGVFGVESDGSNMFNDIRILIKEIHPEMVNYAVRTWDLKHIIEIKSLQGELDE